MLRNKRKRQAVIGQRQGTDLVMLAGLPAHPLRQILHTLNRDTSQKPYEFDGIPSAAKDWGDLYKDSTLKAVEGGHCSETSIDLFRTNADATPHLFLVCPLQRR